VALLVTVSAAGCSGTDPHRYDKVNAVASELNVTSIGEVIFEERYGTGNFSDDHPTLYMVIAGPEAYADVQKALTASSFVQKGTLWSGDVGHGDTVMIGVDQLKPGDTYYVHSEKKSRTIDIAAAVISITSY
jgi:hypothetical protein